MTGTHHKQAITPIGALFVYAVGFLLVVLLAAMSDMPVSGRSALVLALSQGAGVIAYTLFRARHDGPAWSFATPYSA